MANLILSPRARPDCASPRRDATWREAAARPGADTKFLRQRRPAAPGAARR